MSYTVKENNKKSIFEKGRRTAYWISATVFIVAGAGLTSLPGIIKLLFKGAPVIATVNALPITESEFQSAVRKSQELLDSYKRHFGSYYKNIVDSYLGGIDNPEELALEELVGQKLLQGLALSLPLYLSPEYVRKEIASPRIMQALLGEQAAGYIFTEQGFLRPDVLRRLLLNRGMSVELFEKSAEEYIAGHFALQLIEQAALLTESGITVDTLRNHSRRIFEVSLITLSDTVDTIRVPEGAFSAEEVEAHFLGSNRKFRTYWEPERRSAVLWRFDLKHFSRADASEDPASPELVQSIFMRSADEAINSPRPQQWERFVSDNSPVRSTLSDLAFQSGDPLSEALFSLRRQGERRAFIKKNHGYVITLESIRPSAEVPLTDELGELVKRHMWIEQESQRALALIKNPMSTKGITHRSCVIDGQRADEATQGLLEKIDLSVDRLATLLHPGSEIVGLSRSKLIAYKISLTGSEKIPSSEANKTQLLLESKQRTSLVLIASLRDHAILTYSTEKALQQ